MPYLKLKKTLICATLNRESASAIIVKKLNTTSRELQVNIEVKKST